MNSKMPSKKMSFKGLVRVLKMLYGYYPVLLPVAGLLTVVILNPPRFSMPARNLLKILVTFVRSGHLLSYYTPCLTNMSTPL